jgi:hypothetical protein
MNTGLGNKLNTLSLINDQAKHSHHLQQHKDRQGCRLAPHTTRTSHKRPTNSITSASPCASKHLVSIDKPIQ